MKNRKSAFIAVMALCVLSLAPETFAAGRGGGGQGVGQRLQKRDGSCIRNAVTTRTQTQTKTQTRTQQQLQTGSGGAAATDAQGSGAGAMRRLGPGDGTGNATRPMDGTGYGSPAR